MKRDIKQEMLDGLKARGSIGHRNSRALHAIAAMVDCSETTARKYLGQLKAEGKVATTNYSRRLANRYFIREETPSQ